MPGLRSPGNCTVTPSPASTAVRMPSGLGQDDGQVQFARLGHRPQVQVGADLHVEPHGGAVARELAQQGRQALAHEGLWHAEAQHAGQRRRLEAARQRVERLERLAGVAQELVAVLGQRQAARATQQQGPAGLLLQPADLVADGRLGQVQPPRRPAPPANTTWKE